MASSEMVNFTYGTPKCRYTSQIGTPYQSSPHLPNAPISGSLPWMWFPFKFRLKVPLFLRWIGGIAQVLVTGGAVPLFIGGRWYLGILIPLIVLICFSIPCFYLAYITNWNFKLREGIDWCLGKSAQTKEEWKKTTNPETAKHVFFEHLVGKNFRLVVLNDGSQEIWNQTGSELGPELSGALGLGGFTNGAFGAGLNMDHSDGAYTSRPQGSSNRQSGYSKV